MKSVSLVKVIAILHGTAPPPPSLDQALWVKWQGKAELNWFVLVFCFRFHFAKYIVCSYDVGVR